MYHRILLTNDGSPLSAAAIPYTAALARTQGAEVVLLRVSHSAGERPDRVTTATWTRAIGSEAHASTTIAVEAEPLLRDLASRLETAGVTRVGTLVLHGDPGPVIVEAAQRLEADLVVMSSHGLSGMKRAVLGSVADYVVHHAEHLPVLICHPLPPGAESVLDRIEVSLDGSAFAATALPYAAAIASAAGSSVVLVRAIESVTDLIAASAPLGSELPMPALTVDAAEEMVATQRATVGNELAAIAAQLAVEGVTQVRIEILERNATAAILDVARTSECRLIVMSTHGRTGLSRALLGSVADDVVRNLEGGAVLLVRPTES